MALRRRRVLRTGALGVLGSIAGCLGGSDGSTAGTTTRIVRLGTTQRVGDGQVTVETIREVDSFLYWAYPDAMGIDDAAGGRHVLARTVAEGDVSTEPGFALVTDGERFPATPPHVAFGEIWLGEGDRLDPDRWTRFEVPAPLRTGTARIVVDEAAWRVPDRILKRLRRPTPTFELVEFQVPEGVDPGGTVELSVTVRNASDRNGTFRAVVVVTGGGFPCCVSEPLIGGVPAGDSETFSASFGAGQASVPGGRGGVDVRLKSPTGYREATVPVTHRTTNRSG